MNTRDVNPGEPTKGRLGIELFLAILQTYNKHLQPCLEEYRLER